MQHNLIRLNYHARSWAEALRHPLTHTPAANLHSTVNCLEHLEAGNEINLLDEEIIKFFISLAPSQAITATTMAHNIFMLIYMLGDCK